MCVCTYIYTWVELLGCSVDWLIILMLEISSNQSMFSEHIHSTADLSSPFVAVSDLE